MQNVKTREPFCAKSRTLLAISLSLSLYSTGSEMSHLWVKSEKLESPSRGCRVTRAWCWPCSVSERIYQCAARPQAARHALMLGILHARQDTFAYKQGCAKWRNAQMLYCSQMRDILPLPVTSDVLPPPTATPPCTAPNVRRPRTTRAVLNPRGWNYRHLIKLKILKNSVYST